MERFRNPNPRHADVDADVDGFYTLHARIAAVGECHPLHPLYCVFSLLALLLASFLFLSPLHW